MSADAVQNALSKTGQEIDGRAINVDVSTLENIKDNIKRIEPRHSFINRDRGIIKHLDDYCFKKR
jgi:hypothetical protein